MSASFAPASIVPPAVRNLLRSPDLKRLQEDRNGFHTEDGRRFPVVDGILCLLPEEERGADLGDGRFYDEHLFGELDGSSAEAIEAGVEEELRLLLDDYPRNALVLDVGSGAGRVSHYLGQRRFDNAVSLDFSVRSLRQVRARNRHACIWGNTLCLPFESGAFDLVIATGVVHHTPDPHRAVAECSRVVTPGGRLYLRVYNRRSPYRIVHAGYGSFLRACHEHVRTRWLSDFLGFEVYKRVRVTVFSRPEREERILRAKFGNLMLKKMVYFFGRREIEDLLKQHRLEIEGASEQGAMLRMLCYVARKLA